MVIFKLQNTTVLCSFIFQVDREEFFIWNVCVCLSPSLLSAAPPPVSFRHEVTASSLMSVCPYCQKRDLSACYRWGKTGNADGRKQIRVERGKCRESHTMELQGKSKDQRQLSWGGERTFFPGFSKIIQNVCVTSSAQQKLYCWLKNPWRCSGHMLLLLLFTPLATADPLDWSQDYRISKS